VTAFLIDESLPRAVVAIEEIGPARLVGAIVVIEPARVRLLPPRST
jgi:hypothetical protein